MKPVFDFLLKLCILSLILWTVIWGFVPGGVDLCAVFLAWVFVVLNSLSGYLLFEYAFDRESVAFTRIVFGGLVLRLLLLMILVALVIARSFVAVYEFVLSFFAFYCIYVVIEIFGYQKKNKQKKKLHESGDR